MQSTERQSSTAIFSTIERLISLFFNTENFEHAALNIQIWLGLMHNFLIHKCYFLGLVAFSLGTQL